MIRQILRDDRGAGAAEFALVLPLLMLLTLGAIDFGRYMWETNEAKKAVQYGVRWAVVTDPVEGAINESFLGKALPGGGNLTQGDLIPESMFGEVVCTNAGCSCTVAPCLSSGSSFNFPAFVSIYDRMELIDPRLKIEELRVIYRGSGLGYAGNPNGPDLSPLVTVAIVDGSGDGTGRDFKPITGMLLFDFNMPNFQSTLTAEDLSGSDSN